MKRLACIVGAHNWAKLTSIRRIIGETEIKMAVPDELSMMVCQNCFIIKNFGVSEINRETYDVQVCATPAERGEGE